MKHNIIKTENYLLVVDDSKIKQNDWCIYRTGEVIHYLVKLNTDNLKKITAHLPLNNSPVLEGLPLLPPLKDEVEEVWEQGLGAELQKLPYTKHLDDGQYNDGQLAGFEFGATWGYNAAKKRYKYTEGDLRKAIDMARNGNRKVIDTKGVEYLLRLQEDKIIQSLQQPKTPVAFECEMKQKSVNGSIPVNQEWEYEPKKTTNPQGQTVLVGKYIY
jgi:hypothetical protein